MTQESKLFALSNEDERFPFLTMYTYNGKQLGVTADELCPDCTSPTLWIDDDEDGNPYVGKVFHDAECPWVVAGEGRVRPAPERTTEA
ncbi:hypothetical protein [Mycobacterium paraintracellulare]|uniref:hypothetical protein n=1 Tax=Mycobacterium paraintracellulare TaxID=1138383 RepID=UPI0038915F86